MLKWWIAAEHWYGQNDLAFILNQGGFRCQCATWARRFPEGLLM